MLIVDKKMLLWVFRVVCLGWIRLRRIVMKVRTIWDDDCVEIDIDRLLRCGSLLGNEPQDSTQRSGYQLAGFPITPDS